MSDPKKETIKGGNVKKSGFVPDYGPGWRLKQWLRGILWRWVMRNVVLADGEAADCTLKNSTNKQQ